MLLHALGAWMMLRLLLQLEVRGAWLAAMLFALHPVMAESVAWITERKNVLSLPLFLGALLAYCHFAGIGTKGSAATGRRWSYWLALLLLLAALLAKITAFAFGPVVLVLCWWKRGRVEWRRDVVPTLPFFAIAILLGLLVNWLEKHHVGAHGADIELSAAERLIVAGRAFWFYPMKLLWPANLCFCYPKWPVDAGSLLQWLWPVTAVAVAAGLIMKGRGASRGLAAALLLYAGTMLPCLGVMDQYGMRYAWVWDHWVYLSSVPLFAVAGAVLARLSMRLPAGVGRVSAGLLLAHLVALTRHEASQYRSLEVLWTSTLERNPNCWMAWNNMGNLHLHAGRFAEAVTHYQRALKLHAGDAELHHNLGMALMQSGAFDDSITHFRLAAQAQPGDAGIRNDHAAALLRAGRFEAAAAELSEALRLDPGNADACNNLGLALEHLGRHEEAAGQYAKSISIRPDYADAHNNLGALLHKQGDAAGALKEWQSALSSNPGHLDALRNLANALRDSGNAAEAARYYKQAVGTHPDDPALRLAYGIFLASNDSLDEAVGEFGKALSIDPAFTDARNELGTAYRKQGKLTEAAAEFRRVIEQTHGNAIAYHNLGNTLLQAGDTAAAITAYEQSLALEPGSLPALHILAWTLATSHDDRIRDGTKALQYARQAVDLPASSSNPLTLRIKAAALAETGDFTAAMDEVERALRLAERLGESALSAALINERGLYRAHQPCRQP